jgi:hypothetical protein
MGYLIIDRTCLPVITTGAVCRKEAAETASLKIAKKKQNNNRMNFAQICLEVS